jgi:hypothetical protein
MQEAKDAFKSKATFPKHAGTEVATQSLELTDSELSAIHAGLTNGNFLAQAFTIMAGLNVIIQ